MNAEPPAPASADGPLAVICGSGSLPFTVADAAIRQGRDVLLFALHGWADPARVASYPHHWAFMGHFGLFCRLAKAAGCRDVVFIGGVGRPTLRQLRPDLATLRLVPRIFRLYKGGDDYLLTGVARIFEEQGFRLRGAHEVAPDILMPEGLLGSQAPGERDRRDIAQGLALLRATGPFDVGQAVVLADNHVLAIEGAEGTDRMLERVAELRSRKRIRTPLGTGVLVKAPKLGQDRRIDLPSIGPQTVQRAAEAGLAGIAVIAGSAIVAEPERMALAAERAKVFVVGVPAGEFAP